MVRFILVLFLFSPVICAHTIEIFTLHKIPRQSFPAGAIVYYLDDLSLLQHELNSQTKEIYLAEGRASAMKFAKQFVSKHRKQYQHALKTISKLQSYQVTRVPAIVIDGKYQIVGTTNADLALSLLGRKL